MNSLSERSSKRLNIRFLLKIEFAWNFLCVVVFYRKIKPRLISIMKDLEIKHSFKIDAKPEMIYAALISPHGIHSWFSKNGSTACKVGESHLLDYLKEGQPKSIELKIEELQLNKKVVWRCVKHELPVWRNTLLTFEIGENGDFQFVQNNFDKQCADTEAFENLEEVWKYLMNNLKDFCETGEAHPW